jgi:hypothetical protein
MIAAAVTCVHVCTAWLTVLVDVLPVTVQREVVGGCGRDPLVVEQQLAGRGTGRPSVARGERQADGPAAMGIDAGLGWAVRPLIRLCAQA